MTERDYTLDEVLKGFDSMPWYKELWYALLRTPRDSYWWFIHRFHPSHKYHLVDTGLKPGYHDPDIRIMHAIFSEAERFVEDNITFWGYDEEHRKAWDILTEAVSWWQANKPVNGDFESWSDEDKALQDKAEEHMLAIISIRGYMWY